MRASERKSTKNTQRQAVQTQSKLSKSIPKTEDLLAAVITAPSEQNLTPNVVMQLQRRYGNHFTSSLIQRSRATSGGETRSIQRNENDGVVNVTQENLDKEVDLEVKGSGNENDVPDDPSDNSNEAETDEADDDSRVDAALDEADSAINMTKQGDSADGQLQESPPQMNIPKPLEASGSPNVNKGITGQPEIRKQDPVERFSKIFEKPVPEAILEKQRAYVKNNPGKLTSAASGLLHHVTNYYIAAKSISKDEKSKIEAVIQSTNWKTLVGIESPSNKVEFIKRINNLKFSNQLKQDAKDVTRDISTYTSAASEISAGLTLEKATAFIEDIANGAKETNYWNFAVDTVIGILGKVASALTVGVGLYKLAVQLRRRNMGYFNGMLKASFTNNTDPEQEAELAKTSEEKNRVARGRIAQFGFRKTWRAVINVVVRVTSVLISWLMGTISLLSGGAASIPAGIVALAANVTNAARVLVIKGRGVGKFFARTRGVERQKNAQELLDLAIAGDDDALDIIWSVNPFHYWKAKPRRAIASVQLRWHQRPMMTLTKPESKEAFKKQLRTSGFYTSPIARRALARAIASSMKATA